MSTSADDTADLPRAEFDIGAPLPDGVTVLEASAGTGKTYAIAALAVRYIAEGIPLERLLVVTFTRMATGELRDRLRTRMIGAHAGLQRFLADGSAPDDDLLAVLTTGGRAQVESRCRHLGRAITQFDAMMIATTHSFCQQILANLGIAADADDVLELLDDRGDLVDQVVDDVFVGAFRSGAPLAPFTHDHAREIGRAVALANATAGVVVTECPPGSVPAARVRFAVAVRDEVARRKARQGQATYDDYQVRLRDLLAHPVTGGPLAERLRTAYAVVLIDEFQDTDPVQWEIVERAFATGPTALVLIGDPKQAIYAFRGADVYAYLRAVARASRRETLAVSWRSDAGLLHGLDALFDGARLGPEQIVYRPLDAAPQGAVSAQRGLPHGPPLRVRVLHRDDHPGLRGKRGTKLLSGPAREAVAADLARDVVGLLGSGAEVAPGDIAVLVRTNREALIVRTALSAAGVPAVVAGAGSVFDTPMADEWATLLTALERPASRSHAANAVLTVFVGWTGDRAASADDDDWEAVHERLADWRAILRGAGVAALTAAMSRDGLVSRILRRDDGERDYTDLRHIGQLLHAAAVDDGVRASGLSAWMADRLRAAGRETSSDERTRRLDSDAAAVQVLTIHRSKGMEFAVVYCPYLWTSVQVHDDCPVFHEPGATAPRVVAVGGPDDPDYARYATLALEEARGEDLRLAYVALTRARHQVVLWWAVVQGSEHSPLARLLCSQGPAGVIPAAGKALPDDDAVMRILADRAARQSADIAVERIGRDLDARFRPAVVVAPEMTTAVFGRHVDVGWRRTSYSGIVAAAHRDWASEGREVVRSDDEGSAAADPTGPDDGPASAGVPLPLAGMPANAEVGTVLHAVLERVSFAARDLTGDLAVAIADEAARHGVELGDARRVADALAATLATPLGPEFNERTLCGIHDADRRTELGFEIPLGGGDRPHGGSIVGEIADVLHAHLPHGDPLHAYADRLSTAEFAPAELRGYLTGFIDAVLRLPGGADAAVQYVVVDYKSNLLGVHGEPATAWDYRPAGIGAAMYAADYPLQALLYLVALYRYLRWRLPHGDPEASIAGVAYLFVRGMLGPDGPRFEGRPGGVWAWAPPRGLVADVSDLLDGGDR
jgi:exodeoxyribonuclease V beta subunit